MRSMPALIDIGIMGECLHGRRRLCVSSGIECYQDGLNIKQNNMSLPDFKRIIDEIKGSDIHQYFKRGFDLSKGT